MNRIFTILGARPQIIKAAALSRSIDKSFSGSIHETIIHTGQHYDDNMSAVFFEELGIPKPNFNLNVGSGKHGEQTAAMLSGIEEILLKHKPDAVVLYGDTNSTLAGAIAASKIRIPIVHIEAGLRSFNKGMPEEINRIVCDHLSTLLFAPTKTAYKNLLKEGFNELDQQKYTADHPKVYHSGDIMYDNSLHFKKMAHIKSTILADNRLQPNNYLLVTIHRDSNTDDPVRLGSIFDALLVLSDESPIVIPMHPRTLKMMDSILSKKILQQIRSNKNIKILPPVGFLDMILLEELSQMILTDSGGVQKESYFFEKPCIILRPQTEWVELLEQKTSLICDADKKKIMDAYSFFKENPPQNFEAIFGDGKTAEFICSQIVEHI
jgi:UDP-GlcNAc3NAcA epimerase